MDQELRTSLSLGSTLALPILVSSKVSWCNVKLLIPNEGVSHVLSSRTPRDISIVRSWPGSSRVNDNPWKTPSRIAYAYENAGLDENVIGFEVTPGMLSSSWMKLALDGAARGRYDDSDLARIEGRSMLRIPSNKTHQTVCADFLKGVYAMILDELSNQRLAGVIASTPMEFWFTVPAIWSDVAKADTRAAALAAGFGSRSGDTIHLISEPEAAAISVLTQLADDGMGQIKVRFPDRAESSTDRVLAR